MPTAMPLICTTLLLALAHPGHALTATHGSRFAAGLQQQQLEGREPGGQPWGERLAEQLAPALTDMIFEVNWTHISHTGENYCAKGKLVPEFYVLGAKNAGTTSLAHDLMHLGVMATPRNMDKEWNLFKARADDPGLEDRFFASLPWCPSEQTVLGDFSATTLFAVPMPSDLTWSRDYGCPAKHTDNVGAWDAARLIHQLHATAGDRKPRLVVLLRDPLSRMQSEYYHTKPKFNCLGCMANATFAESLAFSADLLQHHPPEVTDWIWKSMYARHIENFLQYFDATQFMFVPSQEYYKLNPQAFSQSLLSWLGLHGEPWREASHDNQHLDRPPLESELPLDSPARLAFERAIAPENRRLVRVLAGAQRAGARMVGYAGEPGDEEQLRAWLEGAW